MSVLDNHFYNGHGMSIGSDTYTGDSYLLVDGLTDGRTPAAVSASRVMRRAAAWCMT